MSSIPDDRLFAHSDRVKGKVLVITGPFLHFSTWKYHVTRLPYEQLGAANGIGKETALRFASYGLAQEFDWNFSWLNLDVVLK